MRLPRKGKNQEHCYQGQKKQGSAAADELADLDSDILAVGKDVIGLDTSVSKQESLSVAADWMRQKMIESSQAFPGVADGETELSNRGEGVE